MEILGLYFEDFPVGKSGTSAGKTIMAADIHLFNEMSSWPNYSVNGVALVPEMLITMVSAGLITRQGMTEGTLVGIIETSWQYKSSVMVGDTLKIQYLITEASLGKTGKKGNIVFTIKTYNQRNEIVAEGQIKAMVLARGNLKNVSF
jgi:acyl dehydratase